MTVRIALMTLLISTVVVYAQEEPFIYDDHGKRDPFGALVNNSGAVIIYDTGLSVGDLTLEGIIADAAGNNLAIVNGRIVKASDKVGPYTVTLISKDHIELSKGQEYFMLTLKKGGS